MTEVNRKSEAEKMNYQKREEAIKGRKGRYMYQLKKKEESN